MALASRSAGATTAPAAEPADFRPVQILDLELAGPVSEATAPPGCPDAGPDFTQASVIVRLRDLPIGSMMVRDLPPAEPQRTERIRLDAARQLGPALAHHLRAAGVEVADASPAALLDLAKSVDPAAPALDIDLPLVTVVICTIGTEPRIRGSVESLLDQTYPNVQVLVVDNDPGHSGIPEYLAGLDDPRLTVLPEPRRGASQARNTGLHASRAAITLFTDDDTLPDRHWVAEIAKVFAEDTQELIGGVTGLVTPGSLQTWHQLLFEEFGSFDKGYRRVIWSGAPTVPAAIAAIGEPGVKGVLFPYGGDVGSGNNMAFRTQRLKDSGGFDTNLGPGTLTKGGEDLDVYVVFLNAGDIMVYTPTALVRHFHRIDSDGLRKQLYGYGTGMAVVVTKHMLGSPKEAWKILRRLPRAGKVLFSPTSTKNERKSSDYPRSLTLIEWKGYAAGPFLYLRAKWRGRKA